MISNWFKGKQLVMAFGINRGVASIGSFVNGPMMEYFASNFSVGFSFMVGFGFCIISLIMGICLVLVDSYAAKKDEAASQLSDESAFRIRDLKEFKLPYWLCAASSVTYYAT